MVAFSDGVLEVLHEDGLAAKETRLKDCAAAEAPDLAALWDAIGIVDGAPGPDDLTCLMISRET